MVSPQVAADIGGRIGTMEEVEKLRSNDSLSLFMRVRVLVSVSKPLRRGCFVSESEWNRTWLNFKYERLVMFCYFCRFVGHDLKHCAGCRKEWRNNGTPVRGLVKGGGWPVENSIKGRGRDEDGERAAGANQNGVEGRRWDE